MPVVHVAVVVDLRVACVQNIAVVVDLRVALRSVRLHLPPREIHTYVSMVIHWVGYTAAVSAMTDYTV